MTEYQRGRVVPTLETEQLHAHELRTPPAYTVSKTAAPRKTAAKRAPSRKAAAKKRGARK